MKLKDIIENTSNPRTISKEQLNHLKKSIKDFKKMMSIRPIIIDENNVIIAGHQRFKALKSMKYKEIPDDWVMKVDNLTESEKKEFMIRDNVTSGEWNFLMFEDEYWTSEPFDEWMKPFTEEDQEEDEEDEEEILIEPKVLWVPDCLFPSNNKYDIPTLKEDVQGVYIENPFVPFGYEKRGMKGVGTYHFYVDDYRFQKIWDKPQQIIESGCESIVEPNLSLFDTTPISWGLHLIYKKRWIARYLQDFGVKIFVDLNVSVKFYEYNLLGVPEGWNAFCTRGYAQRPEMLEAEIDIARKVSGLDTPNMICYGGGKECKEICNKNNLLYVESQLVAKFKNG